jgi:hypothetical protein
MSKIKLGPGDYVMASDIKGEEMHNKLREAFRDAGCLVLDDRASYQVGEIFQCVVWGERSLLWTEGHSSICHRRVYPDQILGKDEMMIIEALKPGMRAKINLNGNDCTIVENRNNAIMVCNDQGQDRYISNISYLTSTEYEIIKDDGPWKASSEEGGYYVSQSDGKVIKAIVGTVELPLRTKEAAEQMAKIQKVYTALMNMPGAFEGDSYHVYFSSGNLRFDHLLKRPESVFDVPFDTHDNAENAATYANKMLRDMK